MAKIRTLLCIAFGIVALIFSTSLSKYPLWVCLLFSITIVALTYGLVRWRWILYTAFGAYQLVALVFTYLVDGHLDLLGLLKYIPAFKFVAFVGITMIALDVIWYFIERRNNNREKDALKEENTVLKAKVYDLQESARKSSEQIKP